MKSANGSDSGGSGSESSSGGGNYSGLIAADVPELAKNSKAFGETGKVLDGLMKDVNEVDETVTRNTRASDVISQQIKGYVPSSLSQAKQLLQLLQAIIEGNAEKAQAISDAMAEADSATADASSGNDSGYDSGYESDESAGGHHG